MKLRTQSAKAQVVQATSLQIFVPLDAAAVREIGKFENLADWYLDSAKVDTKFDYKNGVLRLTFTHEMVDG